MALHFMHVFISLLGISVATAAAIGQPGRASLTQGYAEEFAASDGERSNVTMARLSERRLEKYEGRLVPRRTYLSVKDRSRKEFGGVEDVSQGDHNITKVSKMLYQLIEKFKVRSMVDVPCRGHLRWMGMLLKEIRLKKGESFSYYCVDSSEDILMLVETRLPVLTSVMARYKKQKFWKEEMPGADLVFSWEGLQKMKVKNVASLLENVVSKGDHKYLLIGSSPSVRKNSDGGRMNVRRAPFSYGRPKRMFKKLMIEKKYRKRGAKIIDRDMYLYEVGNMTAG